MIGKVSDLSFEDSTVKTAVYKRKSKLETNGEDVLNLFKTVRFYSVIRNAGFDLVRDISS